MPPEAGLAQTVVAGEHPIHDLGRARGRHAGARTGASSVERVDDRLNQRLLDMRGVRQVELLALAGSVQFDRFGTERRESKLAVRACDDGHILVHVAGEVPASRPEGAGTCPELQDDTILDVVGRGQVGRAAVDVLERAQKEIEDVQRVAGEMVPSIPDSMISRAFTKRGSARR